MIKKIYSLLLFSPFVSNANSITPMVMINEFDSINSNKIVSYEIVRKGGGKNSIIQGITIDNQLGKIYTLTTVGVPSESTINSFDYIINSAIVAKEYSLPSYSLGHQGIAVLPGTSYFFTSASSNNPDYGMYICKFTFKNKSAPLDIVLIRVFDNSFSKNTISSPAISSDGKYLVTYGRRSSENIIRVFDITTINIKSENDISKKYTYEWVIKHGVIDNKLPLQAVASDGKFVYILTGGANKLSKKLVIYTMNGELVNFYNDINLGRIESKSIGKEGRWEPEGLTIDSIRNEMLIMFAMGDKGKRVIKFYRLKITYSHNS